MRYFLFIFLATAFAIPSFAHEPKEKAKRIDFSRIKSSRLERIDKIRSCISRADNLKELRACKFKRARKSK